MMIGLFNSFMLPKFLSIETYAMVKTYNLYITYANLFCFGYNEGMYLKYGGKDISSINKKELSFNLVNFAYLELVIFLILLLISFNRNSFVLGAFSFGMLAFNMITYLKSLYQATGEFYQYGKALNFEKIGIFVFNLILLFILKTDTYHFYIAIQVIVEMVVGIYLLLTLKRQMCLRIKEKLNFKEIIVNIKDGFVLMIGNFSSSIFVGMDRWFVKLFLTTVHFAYYSFAASIESLINVFITPITISFYNYFCKGIDEGKIKILKNSILVWTFAVITVAFPIKWIVINYLEKYVNSLDVIFVLLVAQPFYAVIKGIYVNIYKANKQQNYYMSQMVLMILIGVLLNGAFYLMYKEMIAIAFATLITSIIWLIVCEKKSKYKFTCKEYLAIIIFVLCFLICGKLNNILISMLIYVCVCLITGMLLLRETLQFLIELLSTKIDAILRRIMN